MKERTRFVVWEDRAWDKPKKPILSPDFEFFRLPIKFLTNQTEI